MAIGDDFSVAVNGDIRHTGTSTATYTVLELHRWLQDLADDAAATGDDLLDITDATPSERATDNIITLNSPYNIDDTTAEYFYDGSITQAGGDTVYSGLVVVGSLAGTTTLQVIQDNALYDGASPFWGTGLNADAAQNILMRCLIKTRVTGSDVDGKRIRVQAREWGDSYAEFSVTMGLGNATAAIFTVTDLNNDSGITEPPTWTSIANTEGYQTIDLLNGNGAQPYYSQWDKGSQTLNDVYEYAKYIQRRGTAETIHTLNGELFRGITHEIDYSSQNPTGDTFDEDELVSWGSGATYGQGIILADSEAGVDAGETGTMWIQLLKGVIVTAGATITGATSTVTAVADTGGITARTLSPVFLGQSTGSAIIGAYGIGFDPNDVGASDILFDLNNVQQNPPNNVIFTVSGLAAQQDYVLVGPKAAGNDFLFTAWTLAVTLNGGTETSVVVSTGDADNETDIPNTGILRITLDDGRIRRVPYTAHTSGTNTFTIASTDFTHPNDATAGNGVMMAFIDALTPTGDDFQNFTVQYQSDRNLWVRVRDGGGTPIKTFESLGSLGSGGGSVAANRIPDV